MVAIDVGNMRTVSQVARELGVPQWYIYHAVDSRRVPSVRIAGVYLVDVGCSQTKDAIVEYRKEKPLYRKPMDDQFVSKVRSLGVKEGQ